MLHQLQTWRAMKKRITCTITCTITRATVVYQQIYNGNIANQIHGFTIDYGKFILKKGLVAGLTFAFEKTDESRNEFIFRLMVTKTTVSTEAPSKQPVFGISSNLRK